jgi:hypothetical protein
MVIDATFPSVRQVVTDLCGSVFMCIAGRPIHTCQNAKRATVTHVRVCSRDYRKRGCLRSVRSNKSFAFNYVQHKIGGLNSNMMAVSVKA